MKIWPNIKKSSNLLYKIYIGVAASITAFVTIAAFLPAAWENLRQDDHWSGVVATLHAGFSNDFFREKLGTPSIVTEVSEEPKLTQSIYLFEKFAVATISNSVGEVNIYSVLSCRKDFQPSFTTSAGTNIALQKRPLEQIEQNSDRAVNNERQLTYVPGRTVSSLDQLIESDGGNGSNALRNRQYFTGINQSCINPRPMQEQGFVDVTFSGLSSKAPEQVSSLRRMYAANFYAESYGLEFSIDQEWGHLLTLGKTHESKDAYKLTITPRGFLLPSDFLAKGNLASFNG